MNRGQFLKQMGLSAQALMAFYCLGSITACGGKDDPDPNTSGNGGTPDPGGNSGVMGTTSGNVNFTVDLTHPQYAKLKTIGEFAYVANIILANAKGTIVALSKVCTHEGGTLEYRSNENDFQCTNHGSQFNLNGSVKLAPATQAVTVYKATLSNNGDTLTVTI